MKSNSTAWPDTNQMTKQRLREHCEKLHNEISKGLRAQDEFMSRIDELKILNKVLASRIGYWRNSCLEAMEAKINLSVTMDMDLQK